VDWTSPGKVSILGSCDDSDGLKSKHLPTAYRGPNHGVCLVILLEGVMYTVARSSKVWIRKLSIRDRSYLTTFRLLLSLYIFFQHVGIICE